jgi:hypothetical protein
MGVPDVVDTTTTGTVNTDRTLASSRAQPGVMAADETVVAVAAVAVEVVASRRGETPNRRCSSMATSTSTSPLRCVALGISNY